METALNDKKPGNLPDVKRVLDYYGLEDLILKYEAFEGVSVKSYPLSSGKRIYHLSYGEGGNRLVSVCGLHGNERSSAQFWYKSLNELIEKGMPKNTRYSVVAPANPDGLKYNNRHNSHGIDINRDWYEFSQAETKAIKSVIDEQDCRTIVFDHHECRDDPLYFLEDPGSVRMSRIRDFFFKGLYKELEKHSLPIGDFFYPYTNRHTGEAARSGQLINYTAPKKMFSLIVENMGQCMGEELLDKRMQAHASVDLAGLRTLSRLKTRKRSL